MSSRDSSRSSRRDSPPPRYGSSSSRRRRSPSAGPSRSRHEDRQRDPRSLPQRFGRGDLPREIDDDSSILQRMRSHYANSPLSDLYDCIKEKKKVKIWTRNFKEVRGVMTGYPIAFDKHWNVVIRDVEEVFLKRINSKSPFLREILADEEFQDIPIKIPRQKKTGTQAESSTSAEGSKSSRKKPRKKAKSRSVQRQVPQLFIRGDNIVMICPFEDELSEEEMEGEKRKQK